MTGTEASLWRFIAFGRFFRVRQHTARSEARRSVSDEQGVWGERPPFQTIRRGLRGGKEGQAAGRSLRSAAGWPDPPQQDATKTCPSGDGSLEGGGCSKIQSRACERGRSDWRQGGASAERWCLARPRAARPHNDRAVRSWFPWGRRGNWNHNARAKRQRSRCNSTQEPGVSRAGQIQAAASSRHLSTAQAHGIPGEQIMVAGSWPHP